MMQMNAEGEWLEDVPGRPFLTCCFFTDAYLTHAEHLRTSLTQTQTPHFIKHYPSRGYWEANTRIKPEFLLACLQRFPDRDIAYLDADSIVHAPLELFFNFPGDLGAFVSPPNSRLSHRYLTGTLYLRNTAAVRSFVQDWIDAQNGMVLGVDQDSFAAAIERNPALVVTPLPESYVKIFDRGDTAPVIEHFQASRRHVKLQRALKKGRNTLLAALAIAGAIWIAQHWAD